MRIYIVVHYFDFHNGNYQSQTNTRVFLKRKDAEEYAEFSNSLIEKYELNDLYTIEDHVVT